jgi:hypothetical protein
LQSAKASGANTWTDDGRVNVLKPDRANADSSIRSNREPSSNEILSTKSQPEKLDLHITKIDDGITT